MSGCGSRVVVAVSIVLGSFFLQACGSSNSTTGALSCTATAAVVSGNPLIASTTVELSNLSLAIANGTGPYSVAVSGGPSFTVPQNVSGQTSTSYTYATEFQATSSTSGGVVVSMTDTANSAAATCTISASGTTTGTGAVQVVASSTSAAVGGTITLTASSTDGTVSPTFQFSESVAMPGISVVDTSPTTATVSSAPGSSPETVTIIVTEYASGSLTAVGTTSITLSFGNGTGTTTGNISLTASPSTSVPLGTPIQLTAQDITGISNAVFSFSANGQPGITISNTSTSSVLVTNSNAFATTATILVYEYVSGATTPSASAQITLYFGSSGTPGSVTCTLSVLGGGGAYYVNSPVEFNLTSSNGEQLIITELYAGEPWTGTPPSFIPIPFYLEYQYSGQKIVQVLAQTLSGIPCNGGTPAQTTVYIY